MDKSLLIRELNRIAPLAKPSPQLDTLNPECAKYEWIRNQRVNDTDPHLSELENYLTQQADLVPYREGFLRRSPSGGQSVKLRDVAHWMVAQSKFRDPADVISDFEIFVQDNSVSMYEVRAIWGLHPAEHLPLDHDISLVPLDLLPASQPRDQLFGIRDTLFTEGTSFPQPRPRAAIIRNFLHKPILAPLGYADHTIGSHDLMEQIKQALVLVSNNSIAEISSWYQCDVSTPIVGGVLGWSGQTIEHIFSSTIPQELYPLEVTRSLVQSYLTLDEETLLRLQVPLNRINLAKRVSDLRSLAIELGIALESILTTGSERGSISYKIRQRGAILLGGDSDKKRYAFELLKKIYSLRSIAVHGGILPSVITWQGKEVSTRTFLQEGIDYCSEVIRTILRQGGFPDWDGLIIGW